jgi:HAMP domain-containing protein
VADDIQIEIASPDHVFGSAVFPLTVRITNLTSEEVSGVSVEAITLPGRLLSIGKDDEETEVSELQMTKRRLVEEMERQVQRAYELDRFSNMPAVDRIAFIFIRVLEGYVSLFTKSPSTGVIPVWATEALRIQEWEDVERLERDVISLRPEGTFLKKAFLINKDKLKRCFAQMSAAESEGPTENSLRVGDLLMPAASSSYPFWIRAPHSLRSKRRDALFRVTFCKGGEQKVFQRSVSKDVTVLSSAFAVPTGSMIGAACGYAIRSTIKISASAAATNPATFSWPNLGGSMLLGLVLALLTSRKPDTKKPITVEDFVGGFLIGAAAGLFSEEALKRIGGLFQ